MAKLIFNSRIRLDALLGQCLSIVVTAFLIKIEEAWQTNDHGVIRRYITNGFLCSFESLLSTAGTEFKMLKDVQAGISAVKNSFQLRMRLRKPSERNDTVFFARNSTNGTYIVDVLCADELCKWLKKEMLFENNTSLQKIKIFPVLFTQGVNEWQMLSNLVGTNSLQASVNTKSLHDLMSYCNLCATQERTHAKDNDTGDTLSDSILRALQLLGHTKRSGRKPVELLWVVADTARLLGAGRVTFCKSGKDRTSMSATLEATRLLHGTLGVVRWIGTCVSHCVAWESRGRGRVPCVMLVATGLICILPVDVNAIEVQQSLCITLVRQALYQRSQLNEIHSKLR